MELLTVYTGALTIGLILGLMGGGGSILTVPLLVYVMGINPVIATGYSLFIVGTTSAFGSFQNHLKDNLSVKAALFIAIPSLITVYITRKYLVPAIPHIIYQNDNFTLTKETFIMVLFAVIMLFSAFSMLARQVKEAKEKQKINYFYILPYIIFIGILTGVIGAGGGFLIIPLLVFFAGLPMKKAVGTSLLIITINSLTGFAGDLQNITVDWMFLLSFTVFSIFGIFVGIYTNKYVNETQLKKGFGIFILAMACFILTKEAFKF
jgi:uncharacterized membrane protein YfcA